MKPLCQSGTRLLNIDIEKNIAKVDLSKEFIENQTNDAMQSLKAIYSIVNSLTEITEIEQVQFYIEGAQIDSYNGFFDMKKPFIRSI